MQATGYLGLQKPQEGIDYMRASLDFQAYDLIDAFAQKIGNPFRAGMHLANAGVDRVTGTVFNVGFDTIDYNNGALADLGNNLFNVPTDDFYQILLQLSFSNGNATTSNRTGFIVVNGVIVASQDCVDNVTKRGPALQVSYEANFHSGDVVSFQWRHDDTAVVHLGASNPGTFARISRGSFNN